MNNDISVRAVRGVAWLGSGQLVRQVLAFATNIALARMLVPDDFGLFGMTYVAAEIAQILTDFGLGAAIIQKRVHNATVLTTCFWINLAVGVIVALLLIAIGPFLAGYFGRGEIFPLMVPLALNMIVGSILVVPQALLAQDLRFREATFAQTIGSIAAAIGAVSLAYRGAGVWALAAQPLIGGAVTGVMLYAYARWLPRGRPKWSAVQGMLSFSGNMLGASVISCIGRNLHVFILGRLLGSTALGLYNFASGITGTVLFQVSSVIVRVMFPTLSKLHDDPVRQRILWFKACSMIAILAFPAMAGVIAVAPDLVPVVFGPNWTPAVDVLRILCALMAVQSVLTTSGTVLMAFGRTDLIFRITLVTMPSIAVALWFGAQHGIVGGAISYAAINVLSFMITTKLACRQFSIAVWRFYAMLIPWAFCSVLMGLGVDALANRLHDIEAWIRLSLCIGAGIVIYSLLLLLFVRKHTLSILIDLYNRLRLG